MEEESEYMKLPIDEQCVHKSWKARMNGYEESKKLFLTITDEKSPEFSKFAPLMKKFVCDANAVAQEKALDAVLVFVENANIAGRTVNEVIPGIVAKCLNSPKRNTLDKAVEVILMYCEIEKQDIVQDELIKGFSQKNPKVVCNCIRAVTSALREFGNKVILIKPLVKCMGTLFEDRDKNVRDETKKMVVEMYRWAGAALKPQLKSLKPIQIQELETEFEKVADEKAVPTRYLRSQQHRQAKVAGEEGVEDENEDGEEEATAEEIDPFDLMSSVNIIDNLPKDFYENAESKKWQERKEAFTALLGLMENVKLETGDYGDLVKLIKKTIAKDSNVMIVATASQCLCALAKGLKKRFSPYALSCMETVIEKFKEKKLNVVTALREAIDAVFLSTNIEVSQEIICNALKNKNPSVKAETASFLARAFCYCTPDLLTKKLVKIFSSALLVTLNEPDPTVRDNSAEALGAMMKVVGEKVIMPFLADVDALKMPKIKQSCESAVIKVKFKAKPKSAPVKEVNENRPKVVRGGVRPKTASGGAPSSKKESVANPKNRKIQNGNEDEMGDEDPLDYSPTQGDEKPRGVSTNARTPPKGGPKKPKAGSPTSAASRDTKKTKVPARGGASSSLQRLQEEPDTSPLLQVNSFKQQRALDEQRLKSLRWEFASPRPELIMQLKEQMMKAELNENLLSKMFHSDFKFHIQAIDALMEHLSNNLDACISNLDLILRWLTIRFFDTNPSVILRAMDYLNSVFSLLSSRNYVMTDYEAKAFLPFLIIKLGDPKESIRSPTKDIIKTICHIYAPSKIFPYVSNGLNVKNARQRAECLEVIRSFIENVGVSVCQPTPSAALKEVVKQLADRDNAVRNAALNCLVQVYYVQDEKLYKLIGAISDRDRSLIEERIKRLAKNKKPVISKPPEIPPEVKPDVVSSSRTVNRLPVASSGVPMRHRINSSERFKAKSTDREPLARYSVAYPDYEFLEKLLHDVPTPQTAPVDEVPTYITESRARKVREASSAESENDVVNANVTCDSSQAIFSAISQVSSNDVRVVLSSVSDLHGVIRSPEFHPSLEPHLDQFLVMVSFQLRHVLDTKMAGADASRILRDINECLVSMLKVESLATKASAVVLQDMIRVCLDVLIDTRLSTLDDSPNLVRSMNVLVLRFIQNTNLSNVLSALLKLLHEAVKGSSNSRYLELIVKCNYQVIRRLRKSTKTDVNPVVILKHVHEFLEAFPSGSWADRPSTSPLDVMKLVLNALVKMYGGEILTYVSEIPNTRDSECERYFAKYLHKQSTCGEGVSTGVSSSVPARTSDNNSRSNNGKFSKIEKEALCQIFTKIGAKETTKEGLRLLYEFQKNHPDADMDVFLRSSSHRLRNYIERGLKRVEMEQKAPKKPLDTAFDVQPSGPSLVAINDLVDEFKEMATQAGLKEPYIDSAVRDIRSDNSNLTSSASCSSKEVYQQRDDFEKENVNVLTSPQRVAESSGGTSIETLLNQFENFASEVGLEREVIASMVQNVRGKD